MPSPHSRPKESRAAPPLAAASGRGLEVRRSTPASCLLLPRRVNKSFSPRLGNNLHTHASRLVIRHPKHDLEYTLILDTTSRS